MGPAIGADHHGRSPVDAPGFGHEPARNGPVGLGDASYALYLCHPFAIRLSALLVERFGLMPVLGPLGFILLATILAIAMALALHRLFERRSPHGFRAGSASQAGQDRRRM